jgi:chromate transporter
VTPFALFGYVFRAALFSSGGTGNVSILHDNFVPRHLASDSDFVQALTVGQLSPGPSGLWVVSLGYIMLGPWGSVAALVALLIPPMLVLGIERLYSRVQHHPAVEGFIRGLNLAVVGTFVPILVKILQGSGIDGLKIALVVVAFGLGWVRRIPVAIVIGACGVVGIIAEGLRG